MIKDSVKMKAIILDSAKI